MRQPSKLEIDTEKCRGSANGRGEVFSEFRGEAGRGAVAGPWRGGSEGSMKRPTKWERLRGIAQELGTIAHRGRQVWRLVPWRHRLSLFGALAVMSLASAANTAIWLCVGGLINAVDPATHPGSTAAALGRIAGVYLAIIAAAYLVRECMNVLRRFLVERTCTRIDKDMYVRVVAHLMKVDLAVLAQDHVGAVYGRINRSVEGLVRFVRLTFLEFVPALLTGGFALAAAVSKQPKIALAMLGVAPCRWC